MEAPTPAPETVTAEQTDSGEGSFFILFLLFVPTLVFLYVLPLIATIYSKVSDKRWAVYWLLLLVVNYPVKPMFTWIIGVNAGTFLYLVTGLALVYLISNEKVPML